MGLICKQWEKTTRIVLSSVCKAFVMKYCGNSRKLWLLFFSPCAIILLALAFSSAGSPPGTVICLCSRGCNLRAPHHVRIYAVKIEKRAHSSAGRAQGSQSWGQGFDPPWVHQTGIGRTPISSAADSPWSVRSDPQQKSAVLGVIPRRRFFYISAAF